MDYGPIYAHWGAVYGVPVAVIEAVAETESNQNPGAIGDGGRSWGLFQLYDSTVRGILGFHGPLDRLLDPDFNTELAVHYMSRIIADQGTLNLSSFYSEYNSGDPDLWQSSAEVGEHVRRFLENYGKVVGIQSGILMVVGGAIGFYWLRKGKKT